MSPLNNLLSLNPQNLSSPVVFASFLFLGHGLSSVSLILMNKSIGQWFPHAWTVVFLQNFGTILGAGFGHVMGWRKIRGVKKEHFYRIVLNSLWVILVLWASVRALQLVSVPLYVIARNTVPFQTAFLDYIFLKKRMTMQTIIGLGLTFTGTLIYTYSDMQSTGGQELEGMLYAGLNTLAVASVCVYESATMRLVKNDLSPVELNFYRILFSTPFLIPLLHYEWTTDFGPELERIEGIRSDSDSTISTITSLFSTSSSSKSESSNSDLPSIISPLSLLHPPQPGSYSHPLSPYSFLALPKLIPLVYSKVKPSLLQITISAFQAFSIGSFLLYLQTVTSATSIQLANVGYKFITTLVSRITHPSPVAPLGWVGYVICSLGLIQYVMNPARRGSKEKSSNGGSNLSSDSTPESSPNPEEKKRK